MTGDPGQTVMAASWNGNRVLRPTWEGPELFWKESRDIAGKFDRLLQRLEAAAQSRPTRGNPFQDFGDAFRRPPDIEGIVKVTTSRFVHLCYENKKLRAAFDRNKADTAAAVMARMMEYIKGPDAASAVFGSILQLIRSSAFTTGDSPYTDDLYWVVRLTAGEAIKALGPRRVRVEDLAFFVAIAFILRDFKLIDDLGSEGFKLTTDQLTKGMGVAANSVWRQDGGMPGTSGTSEEARSAWEASKMRDGPSFATRPKHSSVPAFSGDPDPDRRVARKAQRDDDETDAGSDMELGWST